MLLARIDPHTTANPDLVRVTHHGLPVCVHELDLNAQLIKVPQIVRIQESNETSLCSLDAAISCRAWSLVGLRYVLDIAGKFLDKISRLIGRAIIYND